ncbi:MAG: hypothetical protein M3253_01870 [Chloroflexota bacterium]|nr:hypothetical protein [Chloroflexota bacterium]
MADRIARRATARNTPVRAYPHPSDSRPNIPTAELESFTRPEEKRPATVRYPRDPTLDPQLVWKGVSLPSSWYLPAPHSLGPLHDRVPDLTEEHRSTISVPRAAVV